MRAYGLDYNARRPAEFDVAEPRLDNPGDALLRVHEVGVCATDRELLEFRFGQPPDGEHCLALGHEALAQVVECGSDAAGLKPGDWVVPMIRRSCAPACIACARGRRDLCMTGGYIERGINRAHGYFMPYTVDTAADLVAIPAHLVDVAILVEPLSVVEKAFDTALRVHPLEPGKILIFGAGPIGILAAFAAVVRGLECEVVSMEPEDGPRAALVRSAGARYSRGTPAERADLVFEASGSAAAARIGLDWLRPLGVQILIGAADFDIHFPGLRSVVDNLSICGVVNADRAHVEAAVADLDRFERKAIAPLVTRYRVEDWQSSLTKALPAIKAVHHF